MIQILQNVTDGLSRARSVVISAYIRAFWNISRDQITFKNIILGKHRKYFRKLGNLNGIKTVKLTAAWKDISKVLQNLYYPATSNDCRLLSNVSLSGHISCVNNMKQGFSQGHPVLPEMLLKGLPWRKFSYRQPGNNDVTMLTYIHIISHSFTNNDGDVYMAHTKIVPQRCWYQLGLNLTTLTGSVVLSAPLYDEVFTIAQFWGEGFFHATLESLPRLGPYVSFLKHHPHIRIHANIKHPFFSLLGLDTQRVVTGDVRAMTLYMPAGGPCGNPPLFSTQMLAFHLRQHADDLGDWDNIVLIKRSHSKRWFEHHDSILKMLQILASPLGYNVDVFLDDPVPEVNVTRDMFARAFLVVAPHGAGEANMVFSRPGTVLVEGLCYAQGRVNLCYKRMAEKLGLRYHALVFSKNCMNITAEDIIESIRDTLEMKQNGLL